MWLQALYTFALMFVLDFAWAYYIKMVAEDHAFKASLVASVLMIVNGGVVLSYVNNPWMLIPVALGAFSGTYVCIWYRNYKQKQALAKMTKA